MANYRTSRILPTILTIIVIIVAIAGLVALARLLFTGSSSSSSTPRVNVVEQNLLNTGAERAVSMTVRGPIVAEEDFRSYRITVSPSSRQFQTYKGYLDTVIDQQMLSNNTVVYEQFVYALSKANYAKGVPFEGERNDVRGICATGRVYEFNTLTSGDSTSMLWTSTCGGSPGSLRANAAQLSQLFLDQIPEGSSITSSLKL